MGGLQRIRGQEVKVYVKNGSAPIAALYDVRSFSVTPKFTKKEEEYLGETTKRYDELFDGVDFKMELHIEDAGVLAFIDLIKTRARQRTPGATINIQANLQFANGLSADVLLSDCYFENMPLNVGGRSDYVTFELSGSCNDITQQGAPQQTATI